MDEPILAIDIGGTSVKLGIVAPNAAIVRRAQIPFVKEEPERMLGRIARAAQDLMAKDRITRAGVSVAGKVDPLLGTTQADNLGWAHVPVRDVLADKFGFPVWLDNDAECAMLAEWKSGACENAENAVYLTYGTGIGGGLIINGKPYRGRMHSGAELGHIITHGGTGARKCNCGHSGCYEVYASATALKRMAGGKHSVRAIVAGARAGVPDLARVFDAYIEELALGLISVMATLSPDFVVLGGGLSNAGDFFLFKVHARMSQCEDWLTKPTRIVLAKYGNDAGMLGAAALAAL